MTVEEMVGYIRYHNHNDEITEAIVAKLRAAEELAKHALTPVADYKVAVDLARAYEAAGKGEG